MNPELGAVVHRLDNLERNIRLHLTSIQDLRRSQKALREEFEAFVKDVAYDAEHMDGKVVE